MYQYHRLIIIGRFCTAVSPSFPIQKICFWPCFDRNVQLNRRQQWPDNHRHRLTNNHRHQCTNNHQLIIIGRFCTAVSLSFPIQKICFWPCFDRNVHPNHRQQWPNNHRHQLTNNHRHQCPNNHWQRWANNHRHHSIPYIIHWLNEFAEPISCDTV